MERGIILKSGGGELANHLWNYVSIYAYALSVGAPVTNPSFFEYHRYFTLWKKEGLMSRFFSIWFQGKIRRRAHPINAFWRKVYTLYASLLGAVHTASVYSSENTSSSVTYLPPTATPATPLSRDAVYFEGWLFRNPDGLTQYREALVEAFAPNEVIREKVDTILHTLSDNASTHVIGIHLRQGDYRVFKNGVYLISPARMREIVDEYIQEKSLSPEVVSLFIASDGPVDAEVFSGYKTYISTENAVTDMFVLSHTHILIGSNSSFGHFASWYGNIPHIVAETGVMDWNYYRNQTAYFKNTYCTLARL
jgi:hypothetical protein